MFRCVDKYYLWVWKDGQQKGQGRKFIIPDKNTQTKIVDIEPCVFHSFRSEQTTHVYCNFWMECKKKRSLGSTVHVFTFLPETAVHSF